MHDYNYLEGKTFCIVFVKVIDAASERVQLRCFRGRANTRRGAIQVVHANGCCFDIPSSAWGSINANDGTAILGDAQYYCLVKTDANISFADDDAQWADA